jgi:hypothetical protein
MRVWLGLAVLCAVSIMAAAQAASAQDARPERAPAATQSEQAPQLAVVTMAAERSDGRLSPALQRALESQNIDLIVQALPAFRQSEAMATPAESVPLTVGTKPQAHICNGGNCACAGALDCANMIDDGICEEGTIGCNDHGCTCAEG